MNTLTAVAASLSPTSGAGFCPSSPRLNLLVRQIRFEAIGIHSYELVDPAGGELPLVTAGAHIDVHLDGGIVRQYSLANDPVERHRYVIGVLRDDSGRGGSKALHASLRVQDIVSVSLPRNNFAVAEGAARHILIAGGIGLTPLKAMAHQLERAAADYEFHYCCKGQDFAAFSAQLAPLIAGGSLTMHFDGGDAANGLDIVQLLATHTAGTHLYYCGPGGFMHACAQAAAHWPLGTVHFEHFKAPQIPEIQNTLDHQLQGSISTVELALGYFQIQIASTGMIFNVPEAKSIVEVLRAADFSIETSCEAGLCGTCKLGFISGEVDHRDFILSEEEHKDHLTACVSRCHSKMLVLDL